MALPTSYMTGGFTKIPAYFDAMLTAKAPEKFTIKFFETLGFTSSYDRLFINVLKSIGLLDDLGAPTNEYFEFLDQSKSKIIIADGIRKGYSDLFQINKNAQTMTKVEVEGKLKTLTAGSKSAKIISCMASTFKNLCDYADWTQQEIPKKIENADIKSSIKQNENNVDGMNVSENKTSRELTLNYDIHIHLPTTRDSAIYDALFESLTKHISIK